MIKITLFSILLFEICIEIENKMAKHIYNVNLKWLADRKGEISSPDLLHKIEVATPSQFPKGVEGVWSPEHLFTGAINACFMTTFLAIAENSKLNFLNFSCSARGKMEQVDGRYMISEVLLEPFLTLKNSADKAKAERILQKTEKACLISNSVKSKIVLITTIN